MQLIFAAHAKGMLQTDYVLDNLPFPNKEAAKIENKAAAEQKAASFQQMMSSATPEFKEKVALLEIRGGKG
jgi:DNA-directed RNA polymerase specialized sigma24 family protein